jgi:hypothetical protein
MFCASTVLVCRWFVYMWDVDVKAGSIVWMAVLPGTSVLLASYSAGRIVLWDLSNDHMMGDLRIQSLGVVLNGMKMKKHKTDLAATIATLSQAMNMPDVHNIHTPSAIRTQSSNRNSTVQEDGHVNSNVDSLQQHDQDVKSRCVT